MTLDEDLIRVESDLESAAGRSSEEQGSEDGLLNPKRPHVAVRRVSSFESGEQCPLCQRKRRWRDLLSVLRLKGKRRAAPCQHDRAIIEDYLQTLRTATAAKKRRRRIRTLVLTILVIFAAFGVWNVITLLIGIGPLIWDPSLAVDHFFTNWGQPDQPGEGLTGYPTDFTRDVQPIPCHSHNDYWRRVPLYEALHYGCTGVEADVWLFDDELFVGHTSASLSPNRTFRSLYVDPLARILDGMNPVPRYGADNTPQRINGVFETSPDQTLVLLVDFKMDGRKQWPYVESQLEALRVKNYLTHFDGDRVIDGPITVVATGNAPFDLITANTTYRDIFFDAPLNKLSESLAAPFVPQQPHHNPGDKQTNAGQGETGTDPTKGAEQFTAENSYYASINFRRSIGFPWRGHLSHSQLKKLRQQIKAAHKKGLKARYWGTPNWPVGLRNHVWKVLVEEGADYLNIDDIRSAKLIDWDKAWKHRWVGGI